MNEIDKKPWKIIYDIDIIFGLLFLLEISYFVARLMTVFPIPEMFIGNAAILWTFKYFSYLIIGISVIFGFFLNKPFLNIVLPLHVLFAGLVLEFWNGPQPNAPGWIDGSWAITPISTWVSKIFIFLHPQFSLAINIPGRIHYILYSSALTYVFILRTRILKK